MTVETKYNSTGKASYKAKLDKTIRSCGGKQMDDIWIRHTLNIQIKDRIILDDILENGSINLLAGVSKNGAKISFQEITNNAKKLTKINL